jgi:hypothetical protein
MKEEFMKEGGPTASSSVDEPNHNYNGPSNKYD